MVCVREKKRKPRTNSQPVPASPAEFEPHGRPHWSIHLMNYRITENIRPDTHSVYYDGEHREKHKWIPNSAWLSASRVSCTALFCLFSLSVFLFFCLSLPLSFSLFLFLCLSLLMYLINFLSFFHFFLSTFSFIFPSCCLSLCLYFTCKYIRSLQYIVVLGTILFNPTNQLKTY